MARVPVWNGGVAPAPLPTPMARPAPNTGLDDFGRGIQQAANTGIAIAESWRKKAETIQKDDLLAKQEQWWTENFHDDQNGFKTKKGEAAFGGEEKLFADYEKARQGWLAEIASPRAREAAAAASQKTLLAHRRQTENYISQQREVAAGASLVARKATALDALALNYADPAERERLRSEIAESERTHAVSKEAADAAVAQWNKEVDALVIRRFLDEKDADGAKAYFAQARDRLGKDAARIGREIDMAGRDAEVEQTALSLIQKHTGDNGRVDGDTAIAAVDDIKDEALRAEVRKQVEHRALRGQQAWARKIAEQKNLAIIQYEQGGNSLGAIDPRLKAWFLDEPNGAASVWQDLERMAQADADRWRRLAKEGSSGTSEEDLLARAELVQALRENPEEYANMSAEEFHAEWRPKMSAASYRWAVSQFDQHGRRVANGQIANMTEFNVAVKGAVSANGITNKEEKARIDGRMASWLDGYLSENNQRWPKQSEIQAEIAKQVEEVKASVWYGTRTKRRSQVEDLTTIVDDEDDSGASGEWDAPPMSRRDRARQLFQQGVSAEDAERILANEGF